MKLLQFLRLPGHSVLADGVLVLRGVSMNGQKGTLYAVLLGIARFARHCAGHRRFPSASFKLNLQEGLSSRLLTLHCKTANGAGLASGAPVPIACCLKNILFSPE